MRLWQLYALADFPWNLDRITQNRLGVDSSGTKDEAMQIE